MKAEEKQALIECCKTISAWREKYGDFANVMLPAIEAQEIAKIALAALTAQPVKFPKRHSMLVKTDFREGYQSCMAFRADDVISAIRAAGYEVQE